MTEYKAERDPERCPLHPGVVLDDILQDIGRSKTEVARLLGISRQHLHDITAERKPVSPKVAARLAKLLGGGAGSWLRMQADYDAWHAEREVDTSGIETLKVA